MSRREVVTCLCVRILEYIACLVRERQNIAVLFVGNKKAERGCFLHCSRVPGRVLVERGGRDLLYSKRSSANKIPLFVFDRSPQCQQRARWIKIVLLQIG